MKGRFPSFFVQEAEPLLKQDIENYIEEYRPYIKFVAKKRNNCLDYHSLEDIESFIILELIQLYPKKYKYTDFDWVTRTVIRRKAIDFTCNHIKKNEDLIFDKGSTYGAILPSSQKAGGYSDSNEESVINYHFIERSINDHKSKEKAENIVLLVKDIDFKINNTYRQFFSDWAREFIEVVLELHESGYDCNREDIMACLGYDSNEVVKFNAKLLSFRNKLKIYLDLDMEILFGISDKPEE